MKVIEKNNEVIVIRLSPKDIHLVTSALGEISNILDIDDCETRTGYSLMNLRNYFTNSI